MNMSFRKPWLLALFTAAALSSAAQAGDANRSLGQIHFIGSIFIPTLPGQRFVASTSPSSTGMQPAKVNQEPVSQALARSQTELLDYFASYANRSATLVTAAYP